MISVWASPFLEFWAIGGGTDERSELACAGEYAISSDAVEVVSGQVVFGTCEGTCGGASI